jgi:hypothetical protein
MKPHSLETVRTVNTVQERSPEEKFKALGPIAKRYGRFEKGTVLPETQAPACPKVKVADLPEGFIPTRFFEAMEHNQKISSCCRHPENHEIEARKSHPDEPAPDIYIFHCPCGRKHTRFCLGLGDERPVWSCD